MEIPKYTNKLKILVYPTDNNPYQRLLYRASPLNQHEIVYLNGEHPNKLYFLFGFLLFYPKVVFYYLLGFKIIHIHWIPFNIPLPSIKYNNYFFRIVSTINLFLSIALLKILNYRIIWTFHNIEPHEKIYFNNKKASVFIAQAADGIISHTNISKQDFLSYGIPASKIKVIPHGNYIEYYKNEINRQSARELLNIKDDIFCFLFFGQIRKYKGIDNLINAIANLEDKFLANSKNLILIVGKCSDIETILLIKNMSIKYNIKFVNKYVDDNDIQIYMNASDIVVIPFKRITTSGSLILANSFKKPVIAPLIGPLLEFPSETGFYYEDSLINEMTRVLTQPQEVNRRSINAYNFVKSLDWHNIAIITEDFYRNIN